MPKLNATCSTCNRKITKKDYESDMVVKSVFTGNRWCPRCVLKMIRQGVK